MRVFKGDGYRHPCIGPSKKAFCSPSVRIWILLKSLHASKSQSFCCLEPIADLDRTRGTSHGSGCQTAAMGRAFSPADRVVSTSMFVNRSVSLSTLMEAASLSKVGDARSLISSASEATRWSPAQYITVFWLQSLLPKRPSSKGHVEDHWLLQAGDHPRDMSIHIWFMIHDAKVSLSRSVGMFLWNRPAGQLKFLNVFETFKVPRDISWTRTHDRLAQRWCRDSSLLFHDIYLHMILQYITYIYI